MNLKAQKIFKRIVLLLIIFSILAIGISVSSYGWKGNFEIGKFTQPACIRSIPILPGFRKSFAIKNCSNSDSEIKLDYCFQHTDVYGLKRSGYNASGSGSTHFGLGITYQEVVSCSTYETRHIFDSISIMLPYNYK